MLKHVFFCVAFFLMMSADASAEIINHNHIAGVSLLPQSTMNVIGQQKWYFTHASVGENIIDGLNDLHAGNASFYQLQVVGDDGTPPARTTPGRVYDYARGNPGWSSKFTIFTNAVNAGWQSPKIDFAMDKLCYIDQNANATTYLNMMSSLESACPTTKFVYATMPLTTGEDYDNYLRNQYNNTVRNYCAGNGKLLFDIADIEAFTPSGTPVTFQYSGVTCQKLYDSYTSDGGHLNTDGRQRVAMGWYAVGATAVPEPGSFILLLTGAAACFLTGRRIRQRPLKT